MKTMVGTLSIVIVVAVLVLFNWLSFDLVVQERLGQDIRNESVNAHVYAKWGLMPQHLIFDLWSIEGNASMADVGRTFFSAAASLKERNFNTVTMSYKARAKFIMEGSDFRILGVEFDRGQNPVYLVRTWPEKLRTPSGKQAFGQWSGGWLGVLSRQMEDHNEMHMQWYLNDIRNSSMRDGRQ